jgi:hypothetical protein
MRGGITWDAKRRAGNRDRRDLCFPTLAASSATAHARIGRGILLATWVPPTHILQRKSLFSMRCGRGIVAKSCEQRSYLQNPHIKGVTAFFRVVLQFTCPCRPQAIWLFLRKKPLSGCAFGVLQLENRCNTCRSPAALRQTLGVSPRRRS